jgi:glutathione S-transferase
MELAMIDLFYPEESWAKERRSGAVEAVQQRLEQLATWMNGREYLVDSFSAADILMTTVLRILRHTQLVEEQPTLVAYQKRCEARPSFEKALAEQLAAFAA